MKDDIDSVRGLLDRLKDEKERELLKEVNCSNLCVHLYDRLLCCYDCSVVKYIVASQVTIH